MICVSVGRGRHQDLISQHQQLVERGAELVELRVDYIPRQVNIRRLLENRPGPVVITCRRESDGGKYNGDEAERQMLLRTAITEGADYIDLEEDIAEGIPRFGKTKRIISLHNFRQTPDDLEQIHQRMAALDADIVKLATMANQPGDNLRMLQLVRDAKVPTIGICMGEMGIPSRILAGKFGAPFTYATFSPERTLAPGQLSFREMVDVYRYDQIGPQTKVYGVIADPVGHSMSPLFHNTAFGYQKIDAVYVPLRVPREHLDEFFETASQWDLRGLSVTIPHKQAVLDKLTAIDAAVQGIEAANTIVLDGDQLSGYNTDCQAAMDSLDAALGIDDSGDDPLQGKNALLLGAGGVAKAITYGLRKRGMHVTIASRTLERSQQLAEQFDCKAVEWDHRHGVSSNVNVLVNCTPVGMHPNVDDTPFDKHHLKPSMLVFDTVYNPERTLLVKNAREQNSKVVTGVEMFVRQAALQFKLFTSHEAPLKQMYEVVKRAIGPVKYP